MFGSKRWKWVILGLLLVLGEVTFAQAPQATGKLQIRGYPGEATVIRVNGRAFVDLEDLVQMTRGSITLDSGRAVLTLPAEQMGEVSASAQPASSGFSRPFMAAGIEALASMREWGSTLVIAIRNGLPLGNAINPYRGRAADKVRLAAAAASSDDDRNGLELLRKEFESVQAWSDKLVNARNTMSAANFTLSENALQEDPMFQGIVQCGQYLAQMFAGSNFQDTGACR